ncbi:MAG: hypothetical protein H6581_19575 [Bacteroidia bacterium]|nr:hypothetical protein [Bacteroidia bacterium]
MNYPLLSYCIYLPLTVFIMVYVGWQCYKHGEIYLEQIFGHETGLVKAINKTLLVGYYLVNLGYAVFTLSMGMESSSLPEMIHSLSTKLGIILLVLALLHYVNMIGLAWIGPRYFKNLKT